MSEQDLDTRIRDLVARAVADAPPAPAIDPVTALEPRRLRRDDHHRGWWIGGGAALLAAAAAITTLVLVADTDDRISTPADTTAPTVPTEPSVPVPTGVPSTTAGVPATTGEQVILTAGPDGVVERRGEEVRTLTTAPTAIALATPDGRILVQQPTGEGGDDAPLVLDPADGSTTELFGTGDWDGLVRMHDVELVGGRQLLLFSLISGSDQPDTSTEAIYVVDLETQERVELHAGVASVRSRLTMTTSGYVVGTVADDAGVSFLALAVPGSPAVRDPLTAEQLGLQATYPGCDVECPRIYAVAPDGQSFAWIEGFDNAELVVNDAGVVDRIPLPFPPQETALDFAADGSFLLARAPAPVQAIRIDRDGALTELEGTIATAGPAGSTASPPAFEVTEPGFVAAAGPNGVVLRTLAGDLVRRLDRPATIALPVGDGRVVVQVDESVPSVWLRDGTVEGLWPGGSFPGPVTAHDVAIVDGRPLLLYVVSAPNGDELAVLHLATSQTARVGDLPAALPPGGRLHLAANGLITGELQGGFFVTALPGSAGEALTGQLTEQTLGSDPGSAPLLTVSPDGSWVAWLDGNELVEVDVAADGLGEERRWALPFDTAGAVDVDVLADGVIVSYGSGQDARFARRDGSFGVLEGPVGTQGPATFDGTATPPPAATTTTAPSVDATATMVTAGPDGIAVVHDGGEVRRLDQAAEVAFLTPGGAVIFQPSRTTPDGTPGDPLIWRPDGTVDRLLGELGDLQSYRLHDVAVVGGVPTVLYGVATRAAGEGAAMDVSEFTEVLHALTMAPGGWSDVVIDEMPTWESGWSQLALTRDGLVVGEQSELVEHHLYSAVLPGSPAAAAGPLDASVLGLAASYGDEESPRGYGVSDDGTTVVWTFGTDVVVRTVATGEERRWRYSALADAVVRGLDIRVAADGVVELIVVSGWPQSVEGTSASILTFRPDGSLEVAPRSPASASFAP